MDHVNQATGIDDIEERIVKTEGSLVFGVAVVLLSICECLNLLRKEITTKRMRQLMHKIITDINIPSSIRIQDPLFSPAIL